MKRIAIASVVFGICFKALGAELSGMIEGKVTLVGTPRPETRINLSAHPQIEAAHPNGLTSRRYQVGVSNGLRNVLVYLRGDFRERESKSPKRPAVLEHTNGLFEPHIFGIRTGQALELRNTDNCSFHAMAKSNQEFNYAFNSSCNFTNAEVPIKFKCDVHPWNYAYGGVFSHPFFTTTDKDGSFKIVSVPAGRYTLEILHPATGKTTQEVIVEDKLPTWFLL